MGIPDIVKQLVYEEADFQCSYCGHRQGLNLTIHHISPGQKGRKDDSYENLIVLCHNCQQNLHNKKGITDKEIRRLKRHLVARYLTQAGINTLRLAYKDEAGVIAFPFLVQHLIDMKLLKLIQPVQLLKVGSVGPRALPESTASLYKITEEGNKLTERWIVSKKEKIDN